MHRMGGAELHQHEVTAPKALDNAIVNYVRIVSQRTNKALPPGVTDVSIAALDLRREKP